MSGPEKNHFSYGDGHAEGDNLDAYKQIPQSDLDFKSSKVSLTKSKEKLSSDGAEELLLAKGDEARITRVDMADAKYVVGDQRNGDAKVELDANRREFTGLTKEELLKYADDPFWVRLRWTMFILFWLLWFGMLAGAIGIIVKAPKCSPPIPKTWFERGPIVDLTEIDDIQELSSTVLESLHRSHVSGVFVSGEVAGGTYGVLEEGALDKFKSFAANAKAEGIRIIVELTANFVPDTHKWFELSENRTANYSDFFIWAKGGDFDEELDPPRRKPPTNWVSLENKPAWVWSSNREEYYLAQHGQPDLNFDNAEVLNKFNDVLRQWMKAGAAGIRLENARTLLVEQLELGDEQPRRGAGGAHDQYGFYSHSRTADRPQLAELFNRMASAVFGSAIEPVEMVFTIKESGPLSPELWLRTPLPLRPPSASILRARTDPTELAVGINSRLQPWPFMQLESGSEEPADAMEVAALALLLPSAPVLNLRQIPQGNDTKYLEWFGRLSMMRNEASVAHGNSSVTPVAATLLQDYNTTFLACARWKAGHTGYVVVWNPREAEGRADLRRVPSLPDVLTVHLLTPQVHALTNYTINEPVPASSVLVPAYSSVVLSYVPDNNN